MTPLHPVELGLRYLIAIGFLAVAWFAVETWRTRQMPSPVTKPARSIEFVSNDGYLFIIDHESGRVYRYCRSVDKDGNPTAEWWQETGFKKEF